MEEFNLKLKTAFKLIGIILLFVFILFAGMIIPTFFSTSVWLVIVGMIVSFAFILFIMEHYLAVWFKKYIDYFWSKQEGGVSEEQKEVATSNTIKEGNP